MGSIKGIEKHPISRHLAVQRCHSRAQVEEQLNCGAAPAAADVFDDVAVWISQVGPDAH